MRLEPSDSAKQHGGMAEGTCRQQIDASTHLWLSSADRHGMCTQHTHDSHSDAGITGHSSSARDADAHKCAPSCARGRSSSLCELSEEAEVRMDGTNPPASSADNSTSARRHHRQTANRLLDSTALEVDTAAGVTTASDGNDASAVVGKRRAVEHTARPSSFVKGLMATGHCPRPEGFALPGKTGRDSNQDLHLH